MGGRDIRVGIVAGEPSGDNLGAGLIREFRKLHPAARFIGIGGPAMRREGCQTLYDMTRIEAMGLEDIAGKLLDILRIRGAVTRELVTTPPDIFVGVDAPDFNLVLERKLRRCGITTVHYVSPTVWAWRGYRIHKIRGAVSHMLTLFPFEARYYEQRRIPVSCVGHPIADSIDTPNRERARQSLHSQARLSATVIALLPGSRGSEVRRLGRVLVDAARALHRANPALSFIMPAANPWVKEVFFAVAGNLDGLPLTVVDGQARTALEAADLAVLACGTAALEAALLERPHVVVYRGSTASWWLLKCLRHVQYYSMTNHLLPTPEVPELIQHDVTPQNIVSAVNRLLNDPEGRAALAVKFRAIRHQLKLHADARAAKVVSDLIVTPAPARQ